MHRDSPESTLSLVLTADGAQGKFLMAHSNAHVPEACSASAVQN